jgi:hypothetical protein
MSEQQADNDTTSDTGDMEPTPGSWVRRYPEELDPLVHAESGEFLVMCKATDVPLEEAVANARLIAAAGTAASELPEGYDLVAAVEALPQLLEALKTIESITDPEKPDDWAEDCSKYGIATTALNAARGDQNE